MKIVNLILLVAVFCIMCVTATVEESKAGSITGKVMVSDNVPMSNAQIFIFNDSSGVPPSFDRYWRVPDEVVNADSEGRFNVVLPRGDYYLGAIKRKSGDEIGPLQEGDLFLPFYANGVPALYKVLNDSSLNLGSVSGAKPFSKSILKNGSGVTAIEGVVASPGGEPIENALVFAFVAPSMLGKPLFISEKTGKDGKYLLRVYEGGSYYLKIRNSYGGGAMKTGEITGNYGQEKSVAVEVKTGTIVKGINITGTVFSGQGPKNLLKK